MNRMKKMLVLLLIKFSFSGIINAQIMLPKVVSGKIERIENFESKYVTQRNIDVWLPEGYSSKEKYAVLYMHDGQMLYDPTMSWNKQAWQVDSVASSLFNIDNIKKFIVVGIWNGGQTRHQDYFPQNPFKQLSKIEKDTVTAQLKKMGRVKGTFKPNSNNYLKFIVKELMPYINKKYSVYTNSENTFIAGSSMGGLISMYTICQYPKVFGGAACLSTHWVGTFSLENNPIPKSFINYLSKNLPNSINHKIYFDCGNQTLDALYPAIQNKVDSVMQAKGYDHNNWLTKYFNGDDHSENSWRKRLHIPLEFLFRK